MAVHREARALRARRVRLGRRLARAPMGVSPPTAMSGRSPTTPVASGSARSRRPARSSTSDGRRGSRRWPSPTRSRSTTPRAGMPSATTATCATTSPFARPIASRAGSTAAPIPKWGPAGSRTRGDRPSRSAISSAPCMIGSAGQANLAVDRRRWHAVALRGQRREPGLLVQARPDRGRLDRHLLARPLAVPLRRRRRHGASIRAAADDGVPRSTRNGDRRRVGWCNDPRVQRVMVSAHGRD